MGKRKFIWSRSHDQDGHHAHIMVKTLKNLLFKNQWADWIFPFAVKTSKKIFSPEPLDHNSPETWYVLSGEIVP